MKAATKRRPIFEGKIQAWGNSMGLRITRAIGEAAGLDRGTAVSLELTDEGLLIRPKRAAIRHWTEDELLQGLTPHTAHADELPKLMDQEFSS